MQELKKQKNNQFFSIDIWIAVFAVAIATTVKNLSRQPQEVKIRTCATYFCCNCCKLLLYTEENIPTANP